MAKYYFITGTGTNVGKTYISCGSLKIFNAAGFTTLALKPIASGCQWLENNLRNEDALLLQQHSSIKLPYPYINPFALELTVAPHIAASKQGVTLTAEEIINKCKKTLAIPADIYLMEGVGGWQVPINSSEYFADILQVLKFEIILVVDIRLGCLNHSLLTYHAIIKTNIKLAGWIANCINANMEFAQENIEFLAEKINVPLLGIVPYNAKVEDHLCCDVLY